MIGTLLLSRRDRARLQEVVGIASRFGLGVLLARLGLERGVAAEGAPGETRSLPVRTRLALEALGPTYVKLGQILAMRGDLLPPEWTQELERLHSHAPTLPFEELRPAVEEALGQPPEEAFATVDTTPLAAASMAQVHRARLQDGREVVLKIRRPGIRPRIESDLRLMAQLAAALEATSAEARRFGPVGMTRQLADAILAELDFTQEGRNADRLRADFAGDARVVLPEIHWAWTSETLLVMDHIAGIPPRDGDTLRAAGIDPESIAALGADIVLDMVLIHGRFHGDPHPGNMLCLPGNRIALLDMGMIGHVSPKRREEFIGFVQSLAAGDPALLADVLAAWSEGGEVPRARLRAVADRLVARHGGGRVVLSDMVADFLPLLREEGVTLPPDLLLAFKAMVTLDGVVTRIAPGFDLSDAMRRATLRIARARLSPERWWPILQSLAWELGRVSEDAPRLLRATLRRLEAEPAEALPPTAQPDAIRAAGRWIAGAILAGAALLAAAIFLR